MTCQFHRDWRRQELRLVNRRGPKCDCVNPRERAEAIMRVAFHFNPVYMAALSRGIDWFERNFNREIARDYIKMAQEEIDKEEPERRRKAEIKAKEDEEKAKINAKEDEEKAKIKAKKDEEKAKIKAKEDEEKERRMRLKKSNDMQLKILKAVIKERELKKYEKTMAYCED